MKAQAFAKVNLSLQVRPSDRSGYHPLRSLVRSIDWFDDFEAVLADDDAFSVDGADGVPADESNLAWRAIEAIRSAGGDRRPVSARLVKSIPHAAGLGGGSADAAAALAVASRLLRFGGDLEVLGRRLGADVPFCLSGGAAWMEGHGEVLSPAPAADDFALAVVVPPFELPTARVYSRWDQLGGPEGPAVGGRDLPASLRDLGPLRNDLTPAAVSLRPELGDWIADAAGIWGHPALMTGSGSALFGLFPTLDEATEAARAVPGTRAARGCRPVPSGVRIAPDPDRDA
jgi:4-diphosphocytidyl-2-C-methyl-D-erythritol kinase